MMTAFCISFIPYTTHTEFRRLPPNKAIENWKIKRNNNISFAITNARLLLLLCFFVSFVRFISSNIPLKVVNKLSTKMIFITHKTTVLFLFVRSWYRLHSHWIDWITMNGNSIKRFFSPFFSAFIVQFWIVFQVFFFEFSSSFSKVTDFFKNYFKVNSICIFQPKNEWNKIVIYFCF